MFLSVSSNLKYIFYSILYLFQKSTTPRFVRTTIFDDVEPSCYVGIVLYDLNDKASVTGLGIGYALERLSTIMVRTRSTEDIFIP